MQSQDINIEKQSHRERERVEEYWPGEKIDRTGESLSQDCRNIQKKRTRKKTTTTRKKITREWNRQQRKSKQSSTTEY